MIARPVVVALSASQLIGWGVTFYTVGVFGDRMVADTGWSRGVVHGGFSLALLVMGFISPAIGRAIDRAGGRRVMAIGSLAGAIGLALLATAHHLVHWFAAWVVLGVAMRMSLYDACFAALVRIDPVDARRAITTVTLSGGLASTVFWFVGEVLAQHLGWRGATLVFAGFALLTLPLHLAIPAAGDHSPTSTTSGRAPPPPLAVTPADRRLAAVLFGIVAVATSVLASALAAHLIPLLVALGLALPVAVTVSSLRGVGQSAARFAEFASGGRLHPLDLSLAACLSLPLTLALAPFAGVSQIAALVFSVGGGAGNGLVTIARGAAPLVLFDPRSYGAITGRIGAPAFWFSALAPFVIALVLDHGGATAALLALAVPAVAAAVAAALLRARFRARSMPPA
ncbi:MAG: MFS transporter [Siculibacillus sp.]|nr:MFS transporter [Siculibacillus sp.]